MRNAAEERYHDLRDYMQKQYDLQNPEPSRLTKKSLIEHNKKIDDVSGKVGDLAFDDGSSDKEVGDGAERRDLEDVDDFREEDDVNDAGPGLDRE